MVREEKEARGGEVIKMCGMRVVEDDIWCVFRSVIEECENVWS